MSGVEEIAKQCWQRGTKAVNSGDYDYATEMFHKAAVLVPGNLAYRQSLRAAEFKKYGNNGKGGGLLSKPKIASLRSKLSRARGKNEWDEVDKIAEEGLKLNPWDASFNAAVGEACHKRGLNTVAIFAYQTATGPTGEPENVSLLREFAKVLTDDEKYQESAVIWGKILKLNPTDGEARSNMTANQFEQTIKKGNFDEAETTRDVMPDHEKNKKLGIDPRNKQIDAPGQDPIADMLHQIRKNPKSTELHQKLAALYEAANKLDEAKQALQTAYELSGNDHNLLELIQDIELKQMGIELDRLKSKSRSNPEDVDAKANWSKAARKMLDREIEVYSARTQRYPQNKKIKFDLAGKLVILKRWSEAIPLYQQASVDPRLEVDAIVGLANCFLKDGKLALAKKQYMKVVSKISYDEKPDQFKEVHYALGRICEKEKDFKTAEDHYGEILAVDYEYRDVRERLHSTGQVADDDEN